MTLSELIAKLEGAEVGSRKLDGDIAAALKLHPKGWRRETGGWARSWWENVRVNRRCWEAGRYTTSLDAALSLVPEGWWLETFCEDIYPIRCAGERHEPMGTWSAYLQSYRGGELQGARGKTGPLALCIAALRAIQHMEKASADQ